MLHAQIEGNVTNAEHNDKEIEIKSETMREMKPKQRKFKMQRSPEWERSFFKKKKSQRNRRKHP